MEQEVRLGNNKTCTSTKQQWSVPSIRQQGLHLPDTMENISTTKPKPTRILGPRQNITSQPLQPNDIDILADLTNGKCGLVKSMRVPAEQSIQPPAEPSDISAYVEVEITPSHLPKTIDEVVNKLISHFIFFLKNCQLD